MHTSGTTWAMRFVVLVIFSVAMLFVGSKYGSNITNLGKSAAVNSDEWVAVATDDGLLYFGHLRNQNDQYVTLENAYVAQQNTAAASSTETKNNAPIVPGATGVDTKSTTNTSSNQPQYVLQKISVAQVYGPDDTMQVNRDHVLFFQKLRSDSQIVQTIENPQPPQL